MVMFLCLEVKLEGELIGKLISCLVWVLMKTVDEYNDKKSPVCFHLPSFHFVFLLESAFYVSEVGNENCKKAY